MRVITSPQQMQKVVLGLKRRGKTIGVVPTMGYLHEGHLSLLKASKKKADVTILTLFVNPTQFGKNEDLSRYPRDEKGDLKKAKLCGTNFVFMPKPGSMYPKEFETFVEVTESSKELCGASRPGHFRGVTTVVAKLFNITQPDYAFFGKKDFQQLAVITNMARDLNFPVKVIGMPIIREADGLAMSSRNVYLNADERKQALVLSQSLKLAKQLIASGEKNTDKIVERIKIEISKSPLAKIDYVKCMDAQTIRPLKTYQPKRTLFALAVFFGKTRLIDNLVV